MSEPLTTNHEPLTIFPWQSSQWQQILASVSQQRMPHALLLTGPDGIGLGHFANCLSARLLCNAPSATDTACGACKFCILFKAGNHPDLVRLEPEEKGKQIKIELVRNLIHMIQLSSHYGQYKIAIIDPAEAMNRSSANSLLKTLEEPPPDSLLILVSHQPSLLPVTIRSRCQRLNFAPANDPLTLSWLQDRINDEQVVAKDILTLAQGAPLRGLDLLETECLQHQATVIQDLLDLKMHKANPVKIAEKWLGFGAAEVLQWLQALFLQLARLKLTDPGEGDNNPAIGLHLQELVNRLNLNQFVKCFDLALENYHAVSGPFSLNKQGLLEDFIVYWQSIDDK